MERAVDKRRAEFATVRACARRALGELGLPPVALPRGERGAPRWPDGIVGSMTHCTGYRASAVAWAAKVPTIGIDAEPALPLPGRVLGMVSLPQERVMLTALAAAAPAVCWDRLLFCAKEAVYKAWFPLARRWLGFEDALIEIDPGGVFSVRLLVPGPRLADGEVTGFAGRWLTRDGLLLAAVASCAVG
nr:4'-phosphopantetheinyl transferase superfamily protein [Planosporangium thailandense]